MTRITIEYDNMNLRHYVNNYTIFTGRVLEEFCSSGRLPEAFTTLNLISNKSLNDKKNTDRYC